MGVTLSRLASVQRCLEKLDESIKSLMEAREMLGNNDIYIAIILSKLSVVYRHKGDSKNSLLFAEEAAEITDKHHGRKDHPGKCSLSFTDTWPRPIFSGHCIELQTFN